MEREECTLYCIFRLFEVFAIFWTHCLTVPQNFQGRSVRYVREVVHMLHQWKNFERKWKFHGMKVVSEKKKKGMIRQMSSEKNRIMFLATTSLSIIQILVVQERNMNREGLYVSKDFTLLFPFGDAYTYTWFSCKNLSNCF